LVRRAPNTDNAVNTNRNNSNLIFQKISKSEHFDRNYIRKLITIFKLRTLPFLTKQEDKQQENNKKKRNIKTLILIFYINISMSFKIV
jgi:hypothetical protein